MSLVQIVPKPFTKLSTRVFSDKIMRGRVSTEVYDAFQKSKEQGKPMEKKQSEDLAKSLQLWALEHGCTTFTHWFSPMRGSNAEKYDSLLDINYKTGDLKTDFSATKLFLGETDGSSFPNGGIRSTYEAAAYTSWDVSSPPFIRNDTMYIPSAFIAWTGESLDLKTPLLRSGEAINKQGIRLLRLLGDKESTKVVSNCGWEQEFFVVDRKNYLSRPDLLHCGRTLFGALPSKGQQTEGFYFGQMPLRVRDFLREVEEELWTLGISVNCCHNEVAPAQHEISPIFTLSNLASDQNQIAMEVMQEIANRHGLQVLFHEKPFKGLNGSGKHNNWGLNTDSGKNLFVPGKTKEEQIIFIAFVTALCRAIDVHGDVIRIGIAHAGNDHRLGAQEAPPSIISLYTGKQLEKHLNEVLKGGPLEGYGAQNLSLNFGTKSVFEQKKNVEDRNRTASFPFCGNRFEFRSVGSSQNIAWPLCLLNTTMADSLSYISSLIEGGKSVEEAIRETLKSHIKCVFTGDGYSKEWREEAKKRNLWILPNTVDSLKQLNSEKNQKLFDTQGIFKPKELNCRTHTLFENYIKTIQIEAHCLLNMVTTSIIPAAMEDLSLAAKVKDTKAFGSIYEMKETLYTKLVKENDELYDLYIKMPSGDLLKESEYCSEVLLVKMAKLREVVDHSEKIMTGKFWPYPKYENILYEHHSQGENEFKHYKKKFDFTEK